MKITSAKIETVYHIEYTFEEFIEAANNNIYNLGHDKAFTIDGLSIKEMTESDQLKVFRSVITGLHGDTYQVIAQCLGFDGWKHAGLYNKAKGTRTLTVYREGDWL